MDPLRADDIIDRQRLRRKVGFWRAVAFVLVVGALIALVASLGGNRIGPQARDHVAQIRIGGTITGDEPLLDLIERLGGNRRVRGVIVSIDSPGGTTAGSEAVYQALRRLAEAKPTVAQVETLAASGGYMVAVAADHIVARHSSILGSIGVIVQYPNFNELLEGWGIDVRSIKSSPLKAEPSFFGEPPEGAEEMLREVVMDSYRWFRDLVAERRGFDAATIARLADGSVYSGRMSLDNGLVDELGGEEAARAWLTGEGIDAALPTIEWEPRSDDGGLFGLPGLAERVAARLGLEPPSAAIANALKQRLFLDGLISLWHADSLYSPAAHNP